MGEDVIEKRKEKRQRSEGSAFISLKCFCFTFNLWKCMEQMKYNCKVDFDHQVLVAGGARERPDSNHYGFTPLMMGRELIYPGEKQIKALLSAALRHTIAYINILSWAIQVSKGLVHLHLHKGPLSTMWPPLPFRLSS